MPRRAGRSRTRRARACSRIARSAGAVSLRGSPAQMPGTGSLAITALSTAISLPSAGRLLTGERLYDPLRARPGGSGSSSVDETGKAVPARRGVMSSARSATVSRPQGALGNLSRGHGLGTCQVLSRARRGLQSRAAQSICCSVNHTSSHARGKRAPEPSLHARCFAGVLGQFRERAGRPSAALPRRPGRRWRTALDARSAPLGCRA